MTMTAWRYVLYLVTLVCGVIFGWSTTPDELTSLIKFLSVALLFAFGYYLFKRSTDDVLNEDFFPVVVVNLLLWVGGAGLGVFLNQQF